MRTLNIALQGGGSHGAFTWGVLDALLEDGRVAIEGLSGASAGALNAVALASGYAKGAADPRQAARDSLARIWGQISDWGALGSMQQKLASMLWGGFSNELAPANMMIAAWRNLLSPAQLNPLDINPLRDLLEREIDFAAIARHPQLKVFVSATHVNTGRAVIFTGERLTAQAVMASACLPQLFRAVEIDGESYWDGGYAVNPPLTPLIDSCASRDLMLVQINPLKRDSAPQSNAEILDRISELTFNASLLTQMRSIDFINRLIEEGALAQGRCKHVLLHRVDGGEAMAAYPASSRTSTDAAIIRTLFELGRKSGAHWLAHHVDDIGQRSTIDVRRDYLDDTREDVAAAEGKLPTARGFTPWLAQLFKRRRAGRDR
ncbi:patatin-like phospholipase family protein [Caenimonas aquaedulcis]|uniref:Patatin-like phospholipase family protein n=1 Tax=Caenimonas aquaedulcis TaxID=2793270 RepID=A0A931H6G5_9BURK|nr:patatin-like phospholipase family protein [Caenimonas aquaedulcis]MBG9389303.1 patatin-like phospholipase family protein [Caenimonas aquaedulcis]